MEDKGGEERRRTGRLTEMMRGRSGTGEKRASSSLAAFSH